MSDQFNRGGKNDGNRKYQSINLSQHFSKRDNKSAAKSTTGRGLQSLGKVGVSSRRLPRPAVCSSLKKENAGNDPNVALVPGTGGWGSKKGASQVEVAEGDKGWKEVEDKPPSKTPGFSQEFPSLGEDAPSPQRVELRPHTVKWGEKQACRADQEHESSPHPPAPVIYTPPVQLPINYIYNTAPPQHDVKSKTEEIDKFRQDMVTPKDQWNEEAKGGVGEQSPLGYISPYTQPFPGTPGKLKQEDTEQQHSVKPAERITYHGRTSSHSSLSDPPHEDPELEEAPAEEAAPRVLSRAIAPEEEAAPRVLSRAIAKKQLKAFPREEEEEKEEAGEDWEEANSGEKRASVWESGNVWKVNEPEPPVTNADHYFEDDFSPRMEAPVRERMESGQRKVLQDVSHCINTMSQQITIRQKPKVEILQKGAPLPPVPTNYWQDKLAERERLEAEAARRADYSSTAGSEVRRREEEREYEQERRSIRRRGHDEFYDNERKPERRTRRNVEEVFRSRNVEEVFRSRNVEEVFRSRNVEEVFRSETRGARRPRESRFVRDRGDGRLSYDRERRDRERPRRHRERAKRERPTRRESSSKPEPEIREKIAEETVSSEKEDYPANLETEQYVEIIEKDVPLEARVRRDVPLEARVRRDPSEKYDRHHYERTDFTTYRREPRGDRVRERRPRQTEGIFKLDEKKYQAPRNKARVEKYKDKRSGKLERTTSRKSKDSEGCVSSDEQKARVPKFKYKSTSNSPEEDKRSDKEERPPRRARKAPSLKYYSANPADRMRNIQYGPIRGADEKPKDKVTKSRSETHSRKEIEREPAKEEPKITEVVQKTKIKESAIDKKVKKVEKSKLEMDRLKKMTQSGVDLLTLGIYAVDGKEIDDLESADQSEGFVEVVRKKSKKEPEPEKKPTKTKKKKTVTSKTKKASLGTDNAPAAPSPNVADSTQTATSEKVKQWPANTPLQEHLLMPWINPKRNAWDKPLTFSETEHLEPREKIAPISGESTSLFSSDADLAKKTQEKNWRSSENRPPRFSKPAEKGGAAAKKAEKKEEKKKGYVEEVAVLVEDVAVIPPVVEDLFGIRSDDEDDAPSLTSLVLEKNITSPVLSKGASPDPIGVVQIPDKEAPGDMLSTDTSTQTTPPAPRPPEEGVSQQLITATANLSLTDQLREIGQQAQLAQLAPPSLREIGQQAQLAQHAPPSLREIGQQAQLAPPSLREIGQQAQLVQLAPTSLREIGQQAQLAQLAPPSLREIGQQAQLVQHAPTSLREIGQQAQLAQLAPPSIREIGQQAQLAQLAPPSLREIGQQAQLAQLAPPSIREIGQQAQLAQLAPPSIREIGQQAQLAQLAPPSQPPTQHLILHERNQLFGIQNSALIPGLHTTRGAYNEAPGAHPPPLSQTLPLSQPLLEHFITQPHSDLAAQIIPAINQMGTNNSLVGSHPLSPSLSTLGSMGSRPTTTVDFLKNYMAPGSPTNKIYPVSNHSFVNQNIAHFMTNTPGSMSPLPAHAMSPLPAHAAFSSFHKPSSPKLSSSNLYGTRDSLDPSGMVTFTQQLHKLHSPNTQQLFYQRMVPGQDLYYKMKPSDSILLQSDMSKHLDAKPFNPGPGLVPGHGPQLPGHGPQLPGHGPQLPGHGPQLPGHGPQLTGHGPQLPRPPTGLFKPGLLQHSVAPQPTPGMFPDSFLLPKTGVSASSTGGAARSVPRVKLARDGRLHRAPDMRSKSLITPADQLHMQQQSLAQIQQYQAVLSRGEDPAKGSLPENMKPLSSSPAKPCSSSAAGPSQHREQSPGDKQDSAGGEPPAGKESTEKRAEKRKHNEIRNTYRRRNYGYPPSSHYDYYDTYHEDPYREGRGRGGYRGRFPPPPVYRGYPPPPFRRGAPPRPRY